MTIWNSVAKQEKEREGLNIEGKPDTFLLALMKLC